MPSSVPGRPQGRICLLRRTYLRILLIFALHLIRKRSSASGPKRRRLWVHLLIMPHDTKGCFFNLFVDLRRYEDKFVGFCRLSSAAFDNLMELVRQDITKADTIMRKAISAEERLLITLRFLATGESFASLHLQFRVGISSISQIVKCTCPVIWQKLQPIVMPCPTEETWPQVAAGFQTVANFPNCIGAVDGKHVRVQQPPHSGSLFF